jgi:serpin B
MYRLFLMVTGTLLMFSTISYTNAQSTDQQFLVDGNTAFAFDLYQAIYEDFDGNLFYSPYSISAALAMTYAGANDDTAAQMAATLHFDLPQERLHTAFADLASALESDEGNFNLNIANALWGQAGFGFKSDFLSLLETSYGAGLREVDFTSDPEATREAINAWIEDATEEKIRDMVPEGVINSLTRLVLANAIYFNAIWLHTFEESATFDEPFILLDGTEINVPTMHQQARFNYAAGEGYQVVSLPYADSTMAMTIILPDDFSAFETELDAETFKRIQDSLTSEKVRLSMPKWTIAYSLGLSPTLQKMGLTAAFNPDQADFSGMAEESLFISDVLHKAFVKVDETGTEAAAATVITMETTSLVTDYIDLQINRPFVFAITDQTNGSVLFLGRVMNPTAE